MVLLKSPVSPRWWPVAIAEALAVVKVGNRECEFLKLTPLSRTSAIAGAVCGVTMRPLNPSGTNRMRFLGLSFCADAEVANSVVRPTVSNRVERRIKISPWEAKIRPRRLPLFSFSAQRNCYRQACALQAGRKPFSSDRRFKTHLRDLAAHF